MTQIMWRLISSQQTGILAIHEIYRHSPISLTRLSKRHFHMRDRSNMLTDLVAITELKG